MTARETLHGPPYECPECGSGYQRLGQHWRLGDCSPVIGSRQRDVVGGLVLAGAAIEPGGSLVAKTTTRALAEWTHDQLDWLATALLKIDDETPTHDPWFEVRTPTHHTLERYGDWTASSGPPQAYELSQRAARVWWAYAGGLEWHGEYDSQRTATFSALNDDRAAWIMRVLATAGISGTRVGKRVQFHGQQVRSWLDWIEPAVPGVEYKWVSSQGEYEERRA